MNQSYNWPAHHLLLALPPCPSPHSEDTTSASEEQQHIKKLDQKKILPLRFSSGAKWRKPSSVSFLGFYRPECYWRYHPNPFLPSRLPQHAMQCNTDRNVLTAHWRALG
jgi:hypothetical protein